MLRFRVSQDYILSRSETSDDSGCWEWLGWRNGKGYGQVFRKVDGRRGAHAVHRLAYEAFTGEDPGDLCVCHTCDNPGCVNPEHLWLGTHAENMADKVAKCRQSRVGRPGVTCPHGINPKVRCIPCRRAKNMASYWRHRDKRLAANRRRAKEQE